MKAEVAVSTMLASEDVEPLAEGSDEADKDSRSRNFKAVSKDKPSCQGRSRRLWLLSRRLPAAGGLEPVHDRYFPELG